MTEAMNRTELEVYRSRSRPLSGQRRLKFEMALRLQRAQNYAEAIKVFSSRRPTPSGRRPYLGLGECFQEHQAMEAGDEQLRLGRERATRDREPGAARAWPCTAPASWPCS